MTFDWYPEKAAENAAKHGISFEQAITVFDDPEACYFADADHSVNEMREKVIGAIDDGGIVLVVFTERREDMIRVIRAREATKNEKQRYAKAKTTD